MPLSFKQHIENLFKNSQYFSDSESVLFISKILESIEKIDIELIKILKDDETAKKIFFTQIDDIYVLNQNKLIEFFSLNDYMKNGSYTAYTNKIGLIRKDNFIKKFDDVVLAFPHKDCVLEGGQSKDDDKKKEVFYNEILSSDEIDRLFEPKVLKNIKRYSKDGVEENCEIKDDDNLIIKGNNLIALHSLKKKFAGKIKLIYIDPPYNTGNDSFKYNDNFNHSTWLTFMKNRLEVAKEFLSEDGTISISIDNNELNYIQILLDEIFGIENKKNLITIKRSSVSGAKVINNGVVNVSEFIIIYSKNSNLWKPNKVFRAKERDDRYSKFIKNKNESYEKWEYTTILEAFSKFKSIKKSQLKKELGEYYSIEFEQFIFDNFQNICRFAALDDKAISKDVREMKYISKGDLSKTYKIEREKFNDYYLYNGEALLFFEDRLVELDGTKVFGELVTDIWDDVLPNDLHNEGNVSFKKGKKPEKMIERLINLFTQPNDIVMDYHLGSGTTCAVAHKMGRRYIGIEQMDYIEDIAVERLKKVIDGEQAGISKAVNWNGGGDFVYTKLKQIDTFKDAEIGALNKNMQYLPISEIEDESYKISKEEIAINKVFYGIENE
jgi:adenine-specific DNA-methyltransferase